MSSFALPCPADPVFLYCSSTFFVKHYMYQLKGTGQFPRNMIARSSEKKNVRFMAELVERETPASLDIHYVRRNGMRVSAIGALKLHDAVYNRITGNAINDKAMNYRDVDSTGTISQLNQEQMFILPDFLA